MRKNTTIYPLAITCASVVCPAPVTVSSTGRDRLDLNPAVCMDALSATCRTFDADTVQTAAFGCQDAMMSG